jgi:hypothetical protein
MQLLASRTYQFIDIQLLEGGHATERLFRIPSGTYFLHTSINDGEESILRLESRDALIWIGESPKLFGYSW